MNSLGMGIDAEISDEANRSPLKKWFNFVRAGKLIYLFIFIKKLSSYKPGCMELIIDGHRHLLKNVVHRHCESALLWRWNENFTDVEGG